MHTLADAMSPAVKPRDRLSSQTNTRSTSCRSEGWSCDRSLDVLAFIHSIDAAKSSSGCNGVHLVIPDKPTATDHHCWGPFQGNVAARNLVGRMSDCLRDVIEACSGRQYRRHPLRVLEQTTRRSKLANHDSFRHPRILQEEKTMSAR